ncbi:MAG: RagB/SusD family nutrient uptake outer membrane protein [Cyclobacteriaceae bacterium]|nr:RagB/SusD family nutrient uptake outer membrane protein [Cyclobacteriaceae bacterium]
MSITNLDYRVTKIKVSGILILVLMLSSSCEEFIQIDPPKTEIISETVFSNNASALAAVRGIYSLMMTNQSFTNGNIEKYCGLSADELLDVSGSDEQLQFQYNSISSSNQVVLGVFWREAYSYINNANAILEGLAKSSSISPDVKQQIEGESKFIRAFCHFYLVNLFGDIPYITSTDYRVNATASRMPVSEIYERVLDDLLEAEVLLKEDYSFSSGQRIQPNKGAANALLARVYLYLGDWAKAEMYATKLIDNTSTYSLAANLGDVFLANSLEAIWQLQPVTPELSTGQARLFILQASPSDVVLDSQLIDSFEAGDLRLDDWIGSFEQDDQTYYFPYKYKVYSTETITEHAMVLRLAEQFLIRAEAKAYQDKLSDAIQDLDIIRNRAGLSLIGDTNPSISKNDILLAIEQERKIELFSEWGHRWLDLKRTERAGQILAASKPDWQDTDELYPIPESERLVNPQLTQNPSY